MLKSRRLKAKDDEGSVIMAITVVMVTTLAVLALLVTVNGGLNLARNDQNRTNAFQRANAGIDQALYRLDHQDLPRIAEANYVPTRCYPSACTTAGSFVTAFTDAVGTANDRFDVVAEAVPDGQRTTWRVRSTGRDPSGRTRQAITTITATPVFENGFFATTNFYTNGAQETPAGYDSSRCPDPRVNITADGCDLTNGGTSSVPTRLGTNGVLKLASSTADDYFTMWSGVDMYGRSTQEAADNDCQIGNVQKCKDRGAYPAGWVVPHTNGKVFTFEKPTVVNGQTIDWQSCPNGGVVTSNVAPGYYDCAELNMAGVINVSGSTGTAFFWVNGAVTIDATAHVNEGQRTPRMIVMQNPVGSSPAGYFCGSGGNNPEFWGLLYTPRMQIACEGTAQPTIYGAVVAKFYDSPGAHFDFHWDQQSMYALNDGKYVVLNWRECPPGSTDC